MADIASDDAVDAGGAVHAGQGRTWIENVWKMDGNFMEAGWKVDGACRGRCPCQ